ncbi:hypothetical protein PGH07_08955 [Sulfurovum sp. zt1-1]|uniref:TPM domain-containing protein n=1 Tax=Sulfurovum zhangzhouensis TaxID=3019067 RepID=A0ABT7QZN3_9BACT|nr:hypothetical protein [Sulfurovum zhangzhouensis]MDM5272309.1 hypothetical protein [Sulfurovum zhangzhouensis]
MSKAQVRVTLLALLLPLLLNATHILYNNILKPEVSTNIEKMGTELSAKTGINAYVVATNEPFPERYNLVEYSKKYEDNMSKPYVLFIFAPYAVITNESRQKGRVGFIASSSEVKKLYDYDEVRDAAIDVVAAKDQNSDEDKHNIGVLQGYSELADQIGKSMGVKMTTTIPDDTSFVINILKIFVYTGSIFVFWIFLLRPLIMRIKNGKQ